MPAGPGQAIYERPYVGQSYNNTYRDAAYNPDESAASILQSVKEQEAQFEQLTRELEAERQSVANQLERCKLGSETASMSSISSTDESFHWRTPQVTPQHHHHLEEESDAESRMSGSQLVDSCLRVLQERGLMNVGEDPLESYNYGVDKDKTLQGVGRLPTGYGNLPIYSSGVLPQASSYNHLPIKPAFGSGPIPTSKTYTGHLPGTYSTGNLASNSSGVPHSLGARQTSASSSKLEGPYDRHYPNGSSSPSHSDFSNPIYSRADTVTKPMSGRQLGPGPGGDNPYSLGGYQRSHSPASSQGRGTPTRSHYDDYTMSDSLPPNANYPQPLDSFDQQYAYRDNEAYGSIPARDRYGDQYRATPPIGGSGDPYHGIPHMDGPNGDDRYPPRGDDPYNDARPGENPYGRFLGEAHRQSPSLGQDKSQENPYGSKSQFIENPYGHARFGSEDHSSQKDSVSLSGDRYDPNGTRVKFFTQDFNRGSFVQDPNRGSFADPNLGSYAQDPQYDASDAVFQDDRNLYGSASQVYPPGGERNYDSNRGSYADDRNPYGSSSHVRDIYGSQDQQLDPPYGSNRQLLNKDDNQNIYSSSNQMRIEDPYGQVNRSYQNEENSYGNRAFTEDRFGPRELPNDDEDPYSRDRNSLSRDDDLGHIYDQADREPYDPALVQYQPSNLVRSDPYNQDLDAALDDLDLERRSPSIDSQGRDSKWRYPDLPEVIDFLGHPTNSIKANAAAYLQHLCYNDDNVKAKARTLGAIPALVELVNNEIPEIHRAACGALRNLSYGKKNDQCKKDIRNAGGIPALVRLLRKSPDNDVRELVTGILWNLSSCSDLKKPIIDDGLTVIVNSVIIPHSGWDKNMDEESLKRSQDIYWSTVFRNASGILRNVSSDGEYARKKLRECEGLVDAILHIVKAAIGKNDIDNKCVENCVCILRNLSYACQEVQDPAYLHRRQVTKQNNSKEETTGCFGGNKKKKEAQKIDQRGRSDSGYQSGRTFDFSRMRSEPPSGMELLWQPEVVHIYQPLLSQCSNPETLEAAAGAIQNLAACDWPPSVDIRATVRKERGLPIIVELLMIEADRVVCAAATALRNLALDPRNKELIGKYGMRQLVNKLPSDSKMPNLPVSDDTITAVQATLYEVIKKNPDFALSLLNEEGVERLNHIIQSRTRYSPKVVKFASSILYTMWQFKELHQEYKNRGFKEHHFITKTMAARGGPSQSANNTLNRPRMDLGGSGVNPSQPVPNRTNAIANRTNILPPDYMDDTVRTPDRDHYGDRNERLRPDDIPMNQMGAHDVPAPYASLDNQVGPGARQNDYRPVGGVPLFPNLMPANQPQPQVDNLEPLYAQVNKNKRQAPLSLDGVPPPDGGADSWV